MSDLRSLFSNRTVQVFALVAVLLGAIGETFVFVIQSQKLKVEREVAANAATLQPAEARLAERKARVAEATAANATRLKTAEAGLAEQKARVERAAAQVADVDRQAAADKEEAQAISQAAIAQVAEQKEWVEAELKELNVLMFNLSRQCCGQNQKDDLVDAISSVQAADSQLGFSVFGHPANPEYFSSSVRRKRGWPPGLSRVPIKCRTAWLKWKDAYSYGAFAVSTEETCGFSSAITSIEAAEAEALRLCAESNSSRESKCAVMQRLVPSPFDTPVRQPAPLAVPQEAPKALASTAPERPHGKVVPLELNVHSVPGPSAATVTGKFARGQTIDIIRDAGEDWIEVSGTCQDGRSCKGFVNGRAEFLAR